MSQKPCQQHFNTDELSANLKQKSIQSGLITFASQPLKLILGIGSTAILARLLTPEDFGLLAMITPLFLLVDSLSNFGLETAVIQKDYLDRQQASAIFWRSLKINSVLIGITALLAPVIAWFYYEKRLTGMILGLAVGAFSVCLAFQHKALLKRQMRFGTITIIELISLILSSIVAITAAKIGWGYWALVLQLSVMQVTQSIAQWCVCDWRPSKYIKDDKLNIELDSTMSYGKHLTGFRFLTRIGMHLDRILIGYVSGANALGLYSVAYKWAYFPFEQVYFPMFDVAVSSLSRVQHNHDLYRSYSRQGLMPIFAFCMPALAFSFVEAHSIILLLLGEQWLEAVPLFRLLAVAVYVVSMYRVTKWFYVSTGQTQRQFRWALIHTPVMITAVVIGAQWGALGVAIGYLTGTCLLTYPAVSYCLKFSPLGWQDFIGAVWRPLIASILAAVCLYFSTGWLSSYSDSLFLDFFAKSITYGFYYVAFWLLLPDGIASTLEIIKSIETSK
ncbi:lipopolysaccharide biosynthesis protein [Pleurocapsa sp. PCC 7319]|uniref:lipopolysaccharide biosynthesis protein n=1 Tax=Pleurocapsa sp. PCC 7319 TaxID=118161 RepID=UPI000348698C|nr:lipopolysaccharide biosynthesis protein [Pleurocapsa sp. PCC 7319]